MVDTVPGNFHCPREYIGIGVVAVAIVQYISAGFGVRILGGRTFAKAVFVIIQIPGHKNNRVRAVAVLINSVSGNIRGETNTLPLQVELLYQDYNTVGAFAASSLLAGIALITLVVKAIVEWRQSRN